LPEGSAFDLLLDKEKMRVFYKVGVQSGDLVMGVAEFLKNCGLSFESLLNDRDKVGIGRKWQQLFDYTPPARGQVCVFRQKGLTKATPTKFFENTVSII
jgi:hypothetical protein